MPPRVDYALTPLGESVEALHQQVRDWAQAHVWEVVESQQRYDARLSP